MEMPKLAPEAAKLVASLAALDPRLETRKMFGQPAAFVNGNLCLGAFGGDVFLRLSDRDQALASKMTGVRPFEPMPGRAMHAYLILPPEVLRDRTQSRLWVDRAVGFAASLPPKAAKPNRGKPRRPP